MTTSGSTTLRHVHEALVAAAEVGAAPSSGGSNVGGANATRTWQHAAAGYVKTVPELNAAKMYVGNCLARIKLRVGKRNSDGSIEQGMKDGKPVEGLDSKVAEAATEVINTIRTNIGGQSELMRSAGEKMFVSGEFFLLPEDTPAGLAFDVLSTQELVKEGAGYKRVIGPGFSDEEVPAGVEPIRVWRPDDQFGKLATSSVRACLEVLEELVILTRLVRSSAINRMALAGILAISEDFDDAIDDEAEDNSEESHPLATEIILTGVKAIDDPASAAAWLPFILQGPTKLIKDGINYIPFKGDDAVNVVKRKEAIERLAQGLDLPFEIIVGHQETTFANAAQISQDRFQVHIEPMVQMICDALTLAVLWPALAAKQKLRPDQIKKGGYPKEILAAAITYDADDLVAEPDQTAQIVEVFKSDPTQMAVALSEVRAVLGLDPDKGPDDDEVAKRLAAVAASKAREPAGPDLGLVEGQQPAALPPGQQEAEDAAGVTASIALAMGLAERIAGAASITLERAAEKVGARIRPKLKGAQAAAVDGLPNHELTRALGPEVVKRLLNGDDPVTGEVSTFARTVAGWAAEAGRPRPGQFAEAASALLASAVVDRLYAPESAPGVTAHDCAALVAAAAADA